MSEFIQVGVTAMRDPVTGEFLPSVPLYVQAEDAPRIETPVFDDAALRSLRDKYKQYMESCRRTKKNSR